MLHQLVGRKTLYLAHHPPRRVIFTPSVDIKRALHDTAINITCYNRNGKVIKNVTSGDGGDVEDPDNTDGGSGSSLWQHCLLLLQLSE